MSFNPGNLTQWSATPTPPQRGLPQWWGYFTTDTIATVQAADYFNLGPNAIIGRNTTWYLGDLLYCVCSDGVTELEIIAITPNVITAANAAQVPPGSITTALIANGAVTLPKLAAGITPSHVIKFAGQRTTVGGAAAEAFAVAGALATDLAFVQIVNDGTNNRTALQAVVTANTLTVTFSGDPGADLVLNYQIIRVAA